MTTGLRSEPRGLLILGALMTSGRVRLVIAFAVFAGWMGWLGYAALTKTHAPVLSRAQIAGMTADKGAAVVAEITQDADGKPVQKVKVVKTLTAGGPTDPDGVEVANLADAQGFDGPGEYLLLLSPVRGAGAFRVVGRQSSPGYPDLPATGKPVIYPWTADVRVQAEKLLP